MTARTFVSSLLRHQKYDRSSSLTRKIHPSIPLRFPSDTWLTVTSLEYAEGVPADGALTDMLRTAPSLRSRIMNCWQTQGESRMSFAETKMAPSQHFSKAGICAPHSLLGWRPWLPEASKGSACWMPWVVGVLYSFPVACTCNICETLVQESSSA